MRHTPPPLPKRRVWNSNVLAPVRRVEWFGLVQETSLALLYLVGVGLAWTVTEAYDMVMANIPERRRGPAEEEGHHQEASSLLGRQSGADEQ